MKKICFVTASPLTLKVFMRNHLRHLAKSHEVTAVANFSDEAVVEQSVPGIRFVSIPIVRKISFLADILALIKLVQFFHKERFDAVHSITPKAGLLAMLAACLTRVPYRIHCFTGQIWATRTGFGRLVIKSCDRLIGLSANRILVDSLSQVSFLEREGVVRGGQAEVLGFGSISGVDLERFSFNKKTRASMRAEFSIPADVCLLLFVGRLNRDKGILDLARAFNYVAGKCNNIWLMVVGPDEGNVGDEFEHLCGGVLPCVRRIAFTNTPEDAMSAADIFVLPSYREGFGSVVIEAAACGLPAIASRIYGLTDAVEENMTGLLYPPGDIKALQDCLLRLCKNKNLRHKMGLAAHCRVQRKFSMPLVTAAMVDFYEKLFDSH